MFFKILSRSLLLALLLLATQSAEAELLYFLCGTDEDGCSDGYEQYCECIPINSQQENQPYCFDFDNMTCQLLPERPECNIALVFTNQASCIATLFQSEAYPPCKVVTQSFCHLHAIFICDATGNIESCTQ